MKRFNLSNRFLLILALFLLLLSTTPKNIYAAICACNCHTSWCGFCDPPQEIHFCGWWDCPFGCSGSYEECDSGYCEGCSSCGGGGACFTADTPIKMADDSEKPISEVKEGERVKSFYPETGEITESEVTKVYQHSKEETEGYFLFTTETGKQIKVTPEHRILVLNDRGEKEWRLAKDINEGDRVLTLDEENAGEVAGASDTGTNTDTADTGTNSDTDNIPICTDPSSCLSPGAHKIISNQIVEENGTRYSILSFDTGETIKVRADTPIVKEDGKSKFLSPEEAQAILDQQQSQSQSSRPTLLQILFPPLWLLSKIFKN